MIANRNDRSLRADQLLNHALGAGATDDDRQRVGKLARILGVEVDDPMVLAMAAQMSMVKISAKETIDGLNSAIARFDSTVAYVEAYFKTAKQDFVSQAGITVTQTEHKLKAAATNHLKSFDDDFRLVAKKVLHEVHKENTSKEVASLREEAKTRAIESRLRLEEVRMYEKANYHSKLWIACCFIIPIVFIVTGILFLEFMR